MSYLYRHKHIYTAKENNHVNALLFWDDLYIGVDVGPRSVSLRLNSLSFSFTYLPVGQVTLRTRYAQARG